MKIKTVNDISIAFLDQGQGVPVVLVHGFPFDHTMWNAQIKTLSGTHRVIAPDLRGFGRSSVTPGRVTMRQFADDLAALLDALDVTEPIVLVGSSMGGYVALAFQRWHGQRLRALVLCDTRALSDTPEMATARWATADQVVRDGPAMLIDTMLPKLFSEKTVTNRPAVVDAVRSVMAGTDREAIAAAARGMAERPDMSETLREIDCPTLVLVGEHDTISPPAEMRDLACDIPGAAFVEIPGSGHMTPVERPAEISAAILAFVASL